MQLIGLLGEFGYLAAAKAVMTMLGVPVGAPRLPNVSLAPGRAEELEAHLVKMGFFDWVAAGR